MLEKFEGSVAALREIERQYSQLQVRPLLTPLPHPSPTLQMLTPALCDKTAVLRKGSLPAWQWQWQGAP